MQSIRQYRQIGFDAKARREREKGRPQSTPESSSVSGRELKTERDDESLIVDWESSTDPLNPRNWSTAKRLGAILQVTAIAVVVCSAGAIDAAVMPQAAEDLGVSEVVETLATGVFLVGFGTGGLIAAPFSELFGRNAVYLASLPVFSLWTMGAALAPNIGAQLVFRFLAAFSATAPLTCVGGTISDLYDSLDKTWVFPLFAIPGFGAPALGLVIGSYIGPNTSWRWTEWSMLIATGIVMALVFMCMPETFGPLLLQWKAAQLRKHTGNSRYRSRHELSNVTLASRLKVALTRPFLMVTEPIIILWTLYITVVYIVLFTFLDGYPFIFQKTYGVSQGLTNLIFIAMFIGISLIVFAVPFIYRLTARAVKAGGSNGFNPEVRLWYAMITAPAVPISLFWMGWTDNPSISIWSPIISSVLFGYGTVGIFISTTMYIIDSYEMYSASALTFVVLIRYIVAGGMTVAGLPIYERLGVPYTCTILGCVSAVMVPLPYAMYRWGHVVRLRSKYATSKEF